jgi:hypothetical protein
MLNRFDISNEARAHTAMRYSRPKWATGAISRAGDASVQLASFEAAHVLMTRVTKWSTLKAWPGSDFAQFHSRTMARMPTSLFFVARHQ